MSNEHGTEFNTSGDYHHQGDQVQGDKHTTYGERSVHVENSKVESINTGVQIIIPAKTDPEYARWQRAKQNFIAIVRQSWIEGILKKAIYHEVYHILGVEKIPTKETRLWSLESIPQNEPIPAGKPILEIFQENGRSLLILGEPASGKTITLLQLAEGLLDLAEKEELAPLPIIFNLSSWAKSKLSLVDWMAEEGLVQYGMARPLTKEWVAKQRFIYLLDGLDEVAEKERKNCLEAINQFMAQHPAELVVCCRKKDYEEIQAKLNTRSAVYIQPLTPQQIEGYLHRFGAETAGVRQMLQQDKDLQKLAQSPLLLSLMVMAYQGEEIQHQLTTLDEKLDHLFTQYVARMFRHRPLPEGAPYTQEQALHWVMNLAYGLYKTNQSIFYIEYLQSAWLYDEIIVIAGIWRLLIPVFGLIIGPIYGLIFGLISWLIYSPIYGLIGMLIGGLSGGLIGGLSGALTAKSSIDLYEARHFSISTKQLQWGNLKEKLRPGLEFALIFGFMIGPIGMLIGMVIGGLVGGLIFGLIGMLIGMVIGGLVGGLIFGLIVVLIGMLTGIVNYIWRFTNEPINRQIPNKVIWQTLKNGLIFGLIYGLVFGSIFGLIFGLIDLLIGGLIMGLISGLSSGLIFGLIIWGGGDFFKHYVLRFTLSYYNVLPHYGSDKKLIAFLDAMAERLLLRRVGGGWVFIHRYLLDYFAAQYRKETGNSSNHL